MNDGGVTPADALGTGALWGMMFGIGLTGVWTGHPFGWVLVGLACALYTLCQFALRRSDRPNPNAQSSR